MSSKSGVGNNTIDAIVIKIKSIFGGLSNSIPNYRVNDSAISSVNYANVGGNPVVNIIRDNGPVTGENTIYYNPSFIPKDTMNANDIGTTEHTAAFLGNTPAKAWTDYNVSQFPGYYRSDFKDGKRSLKKFFDSENRFHEVPDNRKFYEVKGKNCPSCYTDVNGTNVCNYNSKLERIPKSLYNLGPNGETILNRVVSSDIEKTNSSQYKTYQYEGDRAMNGGQFYKGVVGTTNVGSLHRPYVHEDVIKCLQ
tara:strand:+ start:250 stop:1002 length:753 start_codon:yes stop_codon:yes gene_type:complete